MSNITLYHGTYYNFTHIDLEHTKDSKDFGRGFYMTQDKDQAEKWARGLRDKLTFSFGKKDVKAYIVSLTVDDSIFKNFAMRNFLTADLEWINYVLYNRLEDPVGIFDYDIVYGKTADMRAKQIIKRYDDAKDYSNEAKLALIKKLRPDNLSYQYCFKTYSIIEFLNNGGVTCDQLDKTDTI